MLRNNAKFTLFVVKELKRATTLVWSFNNTVPLSYKAPFMKWF